ncbi:39S ribosomal protein L44 mitochondrial [Clonorchis sinensis]|uniref:Large ribosomal subunit protein mL44 n=1 Tax=Clonorchis sinensis TaxID=79923 RepID=G7YVK1_CLOSI|nr:39S ribosomal protein L44 mitochondrial [Clonorchis sinensis]
MGALRLSSPEERQVMDRQLQKEANPGRPVVYHDRRRIIQYSRRTNKLCHEPTRLQKRLLCAVALRVRVCSLFLVISDQTDSLKPGHELAESYICAFLRHVYPRVPEEWIVSIVDCLLSTTQLSFTAANLGLRDLVLYGAGDSPGGKPGSINPPSPEITSNSLLSIVGALAEMDLERAYLFIRDFLLTPLVDLDLTGELVVIENPLPLLHGMLLSEGKPPPESRLQYQTGMNTLVACYQVGIYSGETLVGEAPGETPEIAEQEAARQAIRNMVGLSDHRPPLPLYGPAPSFDSNQLAKRNVSVSTYLNLLIQQPQCNLAH